MTDRIESDFYPSPVWTIDALMANIEIKSNDVLLEPSMGDGRVLDRFPKSNEHKWAEISAHRDYLNPDRDYSADVIITNPPFSLALDFIRTALTRDLRENGTVCMLLRMSILGSKDRADFWREFPFTNLIMLTPRPAFVHGRADNSEYAWFIWDYGNRLSIPSLWIAKREEHDPEYANKTELKERIMEINRIKRTLIVKGLKMTSKEMTAHATELYTQSLLEVRS